MKKIFTLLALAFMVLTANAEVTEVLKYEASATLPAGITISGTTAMKNVKIHLNKDGVDCIQLANGYTTEEAYNSNSINLAPAGGFKAGDVITIAGFFNNSDDSKKSAVDIFTLDGTKPTVLFTSAQFINGRTTEGDPVAESYTLTADAATLYIGRQGNTGTNISLISVTRESSAPDPVPGGDTEKFQAISWDGTAYTVAPEFSSIVTDPAKGGIATNATDGTSFVTFGTTNMSVVGVSGANPKDVQETEAGVFPGWINGWGDVKWDFKNQGDILYAYIQGSGNPYVEINAEAVINEGAATGAWRPTYVYYGPKEEVVGDKSYKKSLPVNGTYFKFTPKTDGTLCVKMWANKGNHNTFVMEESSLDLIPYTVEGYINGQNYPADYEDASLAGKKKWLTNEEIQALHDASGNADKPYVIGAGNQPFWGNVIFDVQKDKTYWLLQASSQIGFQGYEFTPTATGIEEIVAAPAAINNAAFNLAGQRVAKSTKGLVIINGKKYLNK